MKLHRSKLHASTKRPDTVKESVKSNICADMLIHLCWLIFLPPPPHLYQSWENRSLTCSIVINAFLSYCLRIWHMVSTISFLLDAAENKINQNKYCSTSSGNTATLDSSFAPKAVKADRQGRGWVGITQGQSPTQILIKRISHTKMRMK